MKEKPTRQNREPMPNSTWGGRFASPLAADAMTFTDSQKFDRALYDQDITASIAHARMLAKQGIITQQEVQSIEKGLEQIREEIKKGQFNWQPRLEDVHMNIENRLTEIIGETGKKLHTARSRNDQVGLTFRLFVADCLVEWRTRTIALCQVFCQLAAGNQDVILPGMTHFQPAQPVSLAHYLLAFASMFKRDAERLTCTLDRVRVSPLGAAALAGSPYPLDPAYVASAVGMEEIYANSMDAVSDRDFVLDSLFDASMLALHMSRFCEELIIWANPAFGYVILPDPYSTGSSIMPQKKNPDIAELIRGKSGRIFGSLMAMLTVMKGLPLAYNRDMQEDKEGFLDANQTVSSCLGIMAAMLTGLSFRPDRMEQACKLGYINATELADYLAARGIPFRDAHHITGRIVAYAEKKGLPLEELQLEEFQALEPTIDKDIYKALDYRESIRRRESPGATGPLSVNTQLENFTQWIAQASLLK